MAERPYRRRRLRVPQLAGNEAPVDGPVRVLAIVDGYPPWVNAGAEWMLHSVLRRFVEAGHECSVATKLPPGVEIPTVIDGVDVYPVQMADDLAGAADVLVGHLGYTRLTVTLATAHRLPLIYLVHDDRLIDRWRLEPQCFTAVAWNSKWIREASTSWTGPSFLCRPPVFCADYAVADDPYRGFVTLVNLLPEKGVNTFYEVAKRQPRRKYLAVVGAYGAQQLPAPGLEHIEISHATPSMRNGVYSRSRVVVLPSSYESWGRVGVEAMAAGCAVIAHPTPGLVESLGSAGIFVDREDIDAWCAALDRLDDPDEWQRASAMGKARAAALETETDQDLVVFDEWVRRCAALSPRLSCAEKSSRL